MMPDPVDQLLARQLGVITVCQAKERGMSRDAIRCRLRQGRWARVCRGVYRLVGSPSTWEQRALAGCLALGPGTALSHGSAAAVLKMADTRKGPIELVVPPGRSAAARVRDVIVHRPLQLPTSDLCRVGPLLLTGPARTIVDMAACLSPYGLQRLVDDALCRRLVSRDRLLDRAATLSGRGRRGSARLRFVLEAWVPGRPTDSAAEIDLVRHLTSSGLPMPVRQHTIVLQGSGVLRVDLAWPRIRLAVELDSEMWHDTPRAFHDDKARAMRLAAAGWEVLPITPRNLKGPAGEDLVAAVRQRLAQSGPQAVGAAGSRGRASSGSSQFGAGPQAVRGRASSASEAEHRQPCSARS